jgi:phosphoribosylformimino-5-aminoimidazole carboxamide ribotide isomerase
VIAYAALDLRGGRVVQLVGGRVEAEQISLPDPVAIAKQWENAGFRALHVVDLDAALGTGSNRTHVEAIIAAVSIPVQVGGGIRDDAAVEGMLAAGAARVIVGTRAIEDDEWRVALTSRHADRIVIAADVRDGNLVTRGWQSATTLRGETFVASLNSEPLAGVLVTDVSREGQMSGIDEALFARLVQVTTHPLIAAGGIRDVVDLELLAAAGVRGAVLGMALYRGAVDLDQVTTEFAA